ncbi:MAG: hypothetical protein U0792_11315 [Gemmataceae bacterium]
MGTWMMSTPVPMALCGPASTGMPSIIEDRGTGTGSLPAPSAVPGGTGMIPSGGPGETVVVPETAAGMIYGGEGYPIEGEYVGDGAVGAASRGWVAGTSVPNT